MIKRTQQMDAAGQPSGIGRILVRNFSRITVVSIRRPASHNAMTTEMWRELTAVCRQIAVNARTRVVLLRGSFDYFTAGSDIKEFSTMPIDEVDTAFALMEEAIIAVEELPVPTIACIKGEALGAGLQLALACDLRVAANNAKLGIPVARMGITIDTPFARRLLAVIGLSRTQDLLYTGRVLEAQEAAAIGLVNYLVPVGGVENYALRVAKTIADHSPAAVRAAKNAVKACANAGSSLQPVPAARNGKKPLWIDPGDFLEGISAFVEKRQPNFRKNSRQS